MQMYGYSIGGNGERIINSDEAQAICWIYEQYLSGASLRKIVMGLEHQGIRSPRGKPEWNRKALTSYSLMKNTSGWALLQKIIQKIIRK